METRNDPCRDLLCRNIVLQREGGVRRGDRHEPRSDFYPGGGGPGPQGRQVRMAGKKGTSPRPRRSAAVDREGSQGLRETD